MKRDDLCHEVRQRLKRLPEPHSAHYGIVPLPPPEDTILLDAEAQRSLERAYLALGKAEEMASSMTDKFSISRVLMRKEAVSSSGIEGTHSTLDELLYAEETSDEEATTAARQVRDYATTLDVLVPRASEQGNSVFTLDLIRELHQRAMKDDADYNDVPGELRERVVWIGGNDISYSTYNPPPPEDVAKCIIENIDYMHNEGMQQMSHGLLTRMAVAHAHFEAVHPFRDGNGRVGRLLLPLMMAADGRIPLYLSPYIEAHRNKYTDALKAAQQRLEWSRIVGYLADAVTNTVEELVVTRRALASLAEAWLKRRKWRKGSAALVALDLLPSYPIITVKRLSSELGVTFKAAAQAVSQLEEAGILTERTGYARNRVFMAKEALMLINRPYGVEPLIESQPSS